MTTLTTAASSRAAADGGASFQQPAKPRDIQNILVAIDFSDCSRAALNYAAFLAEAVGATLTLVHVDELVVYPEDFRGGTLFHDLENRSILKQKDELDGLARTVKQGIPVSTVMATGTAWNEITQTAKSWNADLIVIGTHGSRWKHAIPGSTAQRVLRHAACPVLVVP